MPGPPFQTNVSGREGCFVGAVQQIRHEEDVRVNLARLVVTNRQESRACGVLQRLAANHDLVVRLDDLSWFVVLSRNRRCGTCESHEKGERCASAACARQQRIPAVSSPAKRS